MKIHCSENESKSEAWEGESSCPRATLQWQARARSCWYISPLMPFSRSPSCICANGVRVDVRRKHGLHFGAKDKTRFTVTALVPWTTFCRRSLPRQHRANNGLGKSWLVHDFRLYVFQYCVVGGRCSSTWLDRFALLLLLPLSQAGGLMAR